ncbi:hypothetical protein GCM10022222_42490 [Amycolatopsis ultiminotia]|uniref:Uncharacterized protein n=1 Tax=Amycolatopsis ultiminotia TaxID=543629 RepID=A0ABP6WRD1_9PSEU
MTIDPRLETLDTALDAAYGRVRALDEYGRPAGGRLLPSDAMAAELYERAARLAEALAADLRMAAEAFRPAPGPFPLTSL